ncbi:ABC transporter permease subunit [Arthrobacter sp. 35W]|uniref:ABC transporter permease subunit n=1 Tax=Arthrobacter sp. 35W TaxID=1132441 RepID=UPI000556694A|nr:ABC transporter permease subunit [Arthrobacter sp. 35W]
MRRALADSWRSTLAWAVGLVAVMSLYLPLYPAIGGNAQMKQLLDSLPPELIRALNYDQIATGAGYTQATFFGLMGFLLMSIASVAWGAAAIGGDEEAGLLELTLAHGVSRVQVVLERAAALAVRVAVLSAVVLATIVVLSGPSQLGVGPGHAAGGVLLFAGLALLSGTAALAAGAIGGRRFHGLAAGAAVAVAGYAFNALGNQSSDLSWLHGLSPYHWAYGNAPLANGPDWGAVAAIYGLSAVFTAAAAAVLAQRDVGA